MEHGGSASLRQTLRRGLTVAMTLSPSSWPPLLLHVGYHKTATSWMQQRLFTRDHGFAQIADHAEVFRHILQPNRFHFDPEPFRELIAERMGNLADGLAPVISSEILSGHPFLGGRESDIYAERLHEIAPTARILISIRAQMRILPSVYMQYLLRGGTMTPQQFYEGTNRPGYFGFTPKHFEYADLIGHYQALFGRENVYVVTQESIVKDMQAAAQGIAKFAEASHFNKLSDDAKRPYAPSYPEYGVPVLRRINHVQRSTLNPNPIISVGETPEGLYRLAGYVLRRMPLSTLLKNHHPVSKVVKDRFDGYYAQSNAELAKIIHPSVDLSLYS